MSWIGKQFVKWKAERKLRKQPWATSVKITQEIPASIERWRANIMSGILNQPGEVKMPADTEIFVVFKAKNGFYARMRNGELVVGMSLSEVCTAAQAAATDAAIREDDEDSAELKKSNPWIKISMPKS